MPCVRIATGNWAIGVEMKLIEAVQLAIVSAFTIVGLVPLYLLGGELWRGMTVVMMFGLGVGTALILGLVPLLYLLFFCDRWRSVAGGATKCEPAQG